MRTCRSLLGAIALAIALAGCGAPTRSPAPSPTRSQGFASSQPGSLGAAGLLVAANGRVQETTDDGTLVPFDAPAERIRAAVAAGDRVLVVGVDGRTWVSTGAAAAGSWAALHASVAGPAAGPLIALSPNGTALAAARGDPQAARFDLDLIDVPGGTARRIPVARGLNGPPTWLGQTIVVVNLIPPGGSSGLAAIDVATGAITDAVGPGIDLTASADGSSVAVIDNRGGVLVGAAGQWRAGAVETLARLEVAGGAPGSVAERVAMSSDGLRVAIVRRRADDAADVEIWLLDDRSWSRASVLERVTRGSVSVAWTR
ncbi:MAG TPA: hypothetical protein VGO64_00220 [Candidatus Limnocylindrales bacterium]|nr:hypothetical protein [Candidatus Limnocylindrales bacterium]